MSIFSEKLKEYMELKNEKVYTLSKMCDISRASMYKIVQGTRHPSRVEMVYQIADALGLSPFEKKKLVESYQITMIGKNVYEEQNHIIHLIDLFRERKQFQVEWNPAENHIEEKKYLYGKQSVNREIREMIKREAGKEKGKICMICQPNNEFLQQMLIAYCENKEVEIYHIICMESKESGEENSYNLKNLTQISTILISDCKYEAYYYYDDVQSHFYNLNLLPCAIITESEIIQYTPDYEYAIYDHKKERVEVFHGIFQQFMKTARKMFRMEHGLEKAEEWIDDHKIETILSYDDAGYFLVKQKGKKLAQNLKLFVSEQKISEHSLSKWGAANFNVGKPEKIKRYRIHRELFPVPENFLMISECKESVLIVFEKEKQSWGVLEIYEKSLKRSMYQFISNLDKSFLVY